jgi:hypothetical protein
VTFLNPFRNKKTAEIAPFPALLARDDSASTIKQMSHI